MKRVLIYITLALFVMGGLQAQNVEFEKENFPDDKGMFKEILKTKKEADVLYEAGESLSMVLDGYLLVNKFNPNNALVNFRIGKLYLRKESNHKERALPYLQKAYELQKNIDTKIEYYLGYGHHLSENWDEADSHYKKYQASLFGADIQEEMKKVKKRREEVEVGKKLTAHPIRVFIDNAGKVLNSEYTDHTPIISADESVIMFTSRKPISQEADLLMEELTENIYVSYKVSGEWTKPKDMGKNVNNYEEHDATVALSPDAQSLLIYRDTKTGHGDIYECKLHGDEWSKPKSLGKNINTEYHETSATYSFDGKTIYFVSNRPGGFGGHDIYMSQWEEDKQEWGEAKNLGATINTEYHEEGVFMHSDGRTLYFSSSGHKTMGGYDIFKTILKEDGNWTEPENIGYPVNTPDDDVCFVLSGSGRKGYYASVHADGLGEMDIYLLTFLGKEKPLVLNTEDKLLASLGSPISEKIVEQEVTLSNPITILKGVVRDVKTKTPLEATITLYDIANDKKLATFNSNASSGKYLVSLPAGINYAIEVKREGYLFYSDNFNIPNNAAFQEVERDVDLMPIEVGSIVILKNIFFDYDKSTLRNESINELNRLIGLLNDNPTIKIEISGHTDWVGSDSYNQKLSNDRAGAVVKYLVDHGISANRLTHIGYGESKPIATNETDEGRQLNRRTEFKVTAK